MELANGVAPNGERVVSQENLRATWEQQVAIPPSADVPAEFSAMAQGYALGWVIGEYHGQPLIWHNGGTFGFSAQVAFLPLSDLGIVVLSNGSGAEALTLAIQHRLFEIVFDQPRTFDALVSQQLATTKPALADLQSSLVPVDAEAIAPYLGRYHHDVLGEVTISLQDGLLIFDLGEFQTSLQPLPGENGEPTTYLMADPPMVGAAARFTMTDSQPTMEVTEPLTGETFTFSVTDTVASAATPGQ
jgi:hypothetical protein